jgi:hypothetical protein
MRRQKTDALNAAAICEAVTAFDGVCRCALAGEPGGVDASQGAGDGLLANAMAGRLARPVDRDVIGPQGPRQPREPAELIEAYDETVPIEVGEASHRQVRARPPAFPEALCGETSLADRRDFELATQKAVISVRPFRRRILCRHGEMGVSPSKRSNSCPEIS